MEAQQLAKGWHVRNWGTWGWLETGAKLIGISAGLIAFTLTTPSNTMQVSEAGTPDIVAMGILGLLTLLLVFALVMRIGQREIISVAFAIANVLGHAGLLFYLLRTPDASMLPLIFGSAFVVGEGIKQRFLTATGYTENGAQTSQMLLFVRGLMVTYVVFSILILL